MTMVAQLAELRPAAPADAVRARLRKLRFEERQRLASLKTRIGGLDPERHGNALVALEQALSTTTDRLAEIEAALAGPTAAEITARAPVEGEPKTVAEARAALRMRLQLLLVVLEANVPESCAVAARLLRKVINGELRKLRGTTDTRRGTCVSAMD